MKNNLFDIFVKDKMSGYKPDVPAHIWDKIAANNDKKKPIAFWLSPFGKAAAILVLLTTAGAGAYYFSTKKTTGLPTEIVKQEIAIPIKKENVKSENGDSNKETTDIEILNKSEKKSDNAIVRNVNTFTNNKTEIKEKTFQKNENAAIANASLKIKTKNAEQTLEINNEAIVETIVLKGKISQAELLSSTFVIKDKKITPFGFSIPCPEVEENAAGNKRYIEIYAGPDYAFKSYEDTGTAYIEKRKASTALFYAYTAGVRYTRVFSNGISVKIGANYSQINERFFAKNGYELSHIYTVNSVGDTTSNYYLNSPKFEKSTNVYRSFDIPVQMGYEFGNGKVHANISAGVNINITSTQKGNVIDPTGLAVNIGADDIKATKYKNKSNAGISFLGSASLYYKIKNKLHLLAEPYIRYGLSPNTKAELTLKQRTHTAGLRIGFRKDL